MQPLRELATPLLDLSGPMPYTALQSAFDPFFPKGRLYYWKSTYVHDLSDACIDAILEPRARGPSHMSDITIWHLGGAMSRSGLTRRPTAGATRRISSRPKRPWTDPAQNERNIAVGAGSGWPRCGHSPAEVST